MNVELHGPSMLPHLTPVYSDPDTTEERKNIRSWLVGQAWQVTREALRAYLGEPFYVETDSSCTAGGEEDWWTYETKDGDYLGVYLNAGAEHAMLYVSRLSDDLIADSGIFLKHWTIEWFEQAYAM